MERSEEYCIFCEIVKGRAPAERVYEDAMTLAFMDIHPRAPGHVLVIPKRHAAMIYDLDEEAMAYLGRALLRVAQGLRAALAPQGLSVVQSNGRAAGQEIMHVHFHLIPRGVQDAPSGHSVQERAALAARIHAAIMALKV